MPDSVLNSRSRLLAASYLACQRARPASMSSMESSMEKILGCPSNKRHHRRSRVLGHLREVARRHPEGSEQVEHRGQVGLAVHAEAEVGGHQVCGGGADGG